MTEGSIIPMEQIMPGVWEKIDAFVSDLNTLDMDERRLEEYRSYTVHTICRILDQQIVCGPSQLMQYLVEVELEGDQFKITIKTAERLVFSMKWNHNTFIHNVKIPTPDETALKLVTMLKDTLEAAIIKRDSTMRVALFPWQKDS